MIFKTAPEYPALFLGFQRNIFASKAFLYYNKIKWCENEELFMKLLVDADGCPVIAETLKIAREYEVPVLLICDTSHSFSKYDAEVLTVSKGADSADLALVNRLNVGDIVVTQDYGLAALCLAKRAVPLNQDGVIFTEDNIDAFLLARHTARKIRNAGGRLKGPPKRTTQQDERFCETLKNLLNQL